MRTIQGAALQNALNRLCHVEVRTAQGCIERHDAMREQPEDEVHRVVPSEIVQDQQHPERWQCLGQRDADGESLLPALPAASVLLGTEHLRLREGGQDIGQLRLQPRMEDGVGRTRHSLDAHLAIRWMKQRQLLGGAVSDVFMGILHRFVRRVPVGTRVGQRGIRPSFVFGPDRQPVLLVGRLD